MDVEIKSQHRLCVEKNVTKIMTRETQICVHKHVFVPIIFTQERVKHLKIWTTAIRPSVQCITEMKSIVIHSDRYRYQGWVL